MKTRDGKITSSAKTSQCTSQRTPPINRRADDSWRFASCYFQSDYWIYWIWGEGLLFGGDGLLQHARGIKPGCDLLCADIEGQASEPQDTCGRRRTGAWTIPVIVPPLSGGRPWPTAGLAHTTPAGRWPLSCPYQSRSEKAEGG